MLNILFEGLYTVTIIKPIDRKFKYEGGTDVHKRYSTPKTSISLGAPHEMFARVNCRSNLWGWYVFVWLGCCYLTCTQIKYFQNKTQAWPWYLFRVLDILRNVSTNPSRKETTFLGINIFFTSNFWLYWTFFPGTKKWVIWKLLNCAWNKSMYPKINFTCVWKYFWILGSCYAFFLDISTFVDYVLKKIHSIFLSKQK